MAANTRDSRVDGARRGGCALKASPISRSSFSPLSFISLSPFDQIPALALEIQFGYALSRQAFRKRCPRTEDVGLHFGQ